MVTAFFVSRAGGQEKCGMINGFNEAPLKPEALLKLRDLVVRMDAHTGPWSTVRGGEQTSEHTFNMAWVETVDLAGEALRFLYDHGLMIKFDWMEWDEGRDVLHHHTEDRFDRLGRETVLKLLTKVARGDRFYDGAWAELFESGDAQKLFRRLLEIESGTP
jgi:hypothetical protein